MCVLCTMYDRTLLGCMSIHECVMLVGQLPCKRKNGLRVKKVQPCMHAMHACTPTKEDVCPYFW